MSRAAESEWLERAAAVLAEIPASSRVRLPEMERDGKRVMREVSIRVLGNGTWVATYAERSGDVGASFKPVQSVVVDTAIEAFLWGASCGH